MNNILSDNNQPITDFHFLQNLLAKANDWWLINRREKCQANLRQHKKILTEYPYDDRLQPVNQSVGQSVGQSVSP